MSAERDDLSNIDSSAEERSGAIGAIVPILGEVATYDDLKYEVKMLEREERLARLSGESESARRERLNAFILSNAITTRSLRSYYFVTAPEI